MLIHALISSVGADPEPSVLAIFNSLDEVLAYLVGSSALITLLGQHDGPQLLLVPVGRGLKLLLFVLFFAGILVDILLLRLAVHVKIMRELALVALLAVALSMENANDCLGVHAKRHLLDLCRPVEQLVLFLFLLLLLLFSFSLLACSCAFFWAA